MRYSLLPPSRPRRRAGGGSGLRPAPAAGSPAASGAAFTNARVSRRLLHPDDLPRRLRARRHALGPPVGQLRAPVDRLRQLDGRRHRRLRARITANRRSTTGTRYKLSGLRQRQRRRHADHPAGRRHLRRAALEGRRSSSTAARRIDAQGTADAADRVHVRVRAGRAQQRRLGRRHHRRPRVGQPRPAARPSSRAARTRPTAAAPRRTTTTPRARCATSASSTPASRSRPTTRSTASRSAAVGRATTIDYVQCSYGGDDAFEPFGGTVNLRHVIAQCARRRHVRRRQRLDGQRPVRARHLEPRHRRRLGLQRHRARQRRLRARPATPLTQPDHSRT